MSSPRPFKTLTSVVYKNTQRKATFWFPFVSISSCVFGNWKIHDIFRTVAPSMAPVTRKTPEADPLPLPPSTSSRPSRVPGFKKMKRYQGFHKSCTFCRAPRLTRKHPQVVFGKVFPNLPWVAIIFINFSAIASLIALMLGLLRPSFICSIMLYHFQDVLDWV